MPGSNDVSGLFCGYNRLYGTCNVASHDNNWCTLTLQLLEVGPQCPVRQFSVVPWWSYFPVYVYVVHIFPDSFWDGQFSLYYYWHHVCFYIPHTMCFYCKVFPFSKIFGFCLHDISLFPKNAKSINLLTPNVNYSGRTAPLTSKVACYIFIQQI